jgi:hemolysin D
VIKVDAFPFTRYGTINGVVEILSRNVVDQCDATVLSDAANAAKSQPSTPGSPVKPQDLVFPTNIQASQRPINIDSKEEALIPGMGVSAEIKTGRRRAIDYLPSPLREIAARASRER